MLIEGNSIGEIYPKLLEHLLNQGLPASPRGQATYESLAIQLHCPDMLQNILVHPVRDLNYRFMVAEFLWIMAGRDDVATLVKYNKEYAKFSDDGIKLSGAYGIRLRKPGRSIISESTEFSLHAKCTTTAWIDQLTWCVQKLKNDPDSRQAIAQIWTPCPGNSADIPCTLSLQFLLRQGALHLVTTMRSSDAWLGLPYDWFTMTMIANCMAGELGVQCGSVTFQLGSSHLYEQHKEKALELVSRWTKASTVVSPAMPNLPPTALFNDMLDGDPISNLPMWLPYSYIVGPTCLTKAEALEVLCHAAS